MNKEWQCHRCGKTGGGSLYVGGPAYGRSSPLVRVSATDGRPQPFRPRIVGRDGGEVDAAATSEAGLYVAGPFEKVGGLDRNGIALLDPTTAHVKPWTLASCNALDAGLDTPARVLAVTEGRIVTNCRAYGDGQRLLVARAPAP